jgi:hypothetical protein
MPGPIHVPGKAFQNKKITIPGASSIYSFRHTTRENSFEYKIRQNTNATCRVKTSRETEKVRTFCRGGL